MSTLHTIVAAYFVCNVFFAGLEYGQSTSITTKDKLALAMTLLLVLLFGTLVYLAYGLIQPFTWLRDNVWKRTWVWYHWITFKTWWRHVHKNRPMTASLDQLRGLRDSKLLKRMPMWLSDWWLTMINNRIEELNKSNEEN
jgi:hypothetical protein